MPDSNNNWEKDAIREIALAGIKEQRRSRRWGIFFKLLGFSYLLVLIIILASNNISDNTSVTQKHTAMVKLSGGIVPGEPAAADNIISGLQDAFANKNASGVILEINSPGGTPVQASMIYDEIKRLRGLHPKTPIYTVITDICASGGYYVAAATEQIYANRSSLIGSIGVRLSSFGFTGTMEKLGVERRQLTAGTNKAMLDPFSPRNKLAEAHMADLLASTHKHFIDDVKAGRGKRLKNDPDLFSGLIWNGDQSIELGLIDELGSSAYVAREIIGQKKIVDYTYQPDFFERFSRQVSQTMLNLIYTEQFQHWL
ncbi:MAG: S49 family peptidase [Gammaproteobacteria bacterium]|nr:S49 family peptidase [Gammaproteobacteria bacterium]